MPGGPGTRSECRQKVRFLKGREGLVLGKIPSAYSAGRKRKGAEQRERLIKLRPRSRSPGSVLTKGSSQGKEPYGPLAQHQLWMAPGAAPQVLMDQPQPHCLLSHLGQLLPVTAPLPHAAPDTGRAPQEDSGSAFRTSRQLAPYPAPSLLPPWVRLVCAGARRFPSSPACSSLTLSGQLPPLLLTHLISASAH